MTEDTPSRDELAEKYLDQIPFDPYPVQEEALLAWFSAPQGVLVCAPTGMGKTLIAEAALFEALHTGKTAYYTTPLIALTEQKFREMQIRAVEWGFSGNDVGLVTGNRRENPDARVLVVVAEILFNRLLHREAFDFSDVATVVMDEFHSINDRERGIVWEFSLGLLPEQVRTLLLSATVGNAYEFTAWLRDHHSRRLELVQSDERRVPLTYHWVPDKLLTEQVEEMARGSEDERFTPALVFCFNREQCWTVAEQLKGKRVLDPARKDALLAKLDEYDFSHGAGSKLKQLLQRGVGVHHAGVLPKYRRIVEDLFQEKLLSVATCTETLSAGINLPARSVVLPTILKGPPDKKRVIDPSTAHQIFGRAGRPQFDTHGHVFVLAHEDDVKILRWREEYDKIPEDTKDPGLLKAKKRLKKKQPKRRSTEQYWTEEQFTKLAAAPPGKLHSAGPLPWRMLAHVIDATPEVDVLRKLVSRRLLDGRRLARAQEQLDEMLLTLWRAGYIELVPEPPKGDDGESEVESEAAESEAPKSELIPTGADDAAEETGAAKSQAAEPEKYEPKWARPTEDLQKLLMFRSVHPLYGVFMINQLGPADRDERIQAIESVLELPGSVGHFVRVPRHDELPPGRLATGRLDEQLLRLGLVTPEQLAEPSEEERYERRRTFDEARPWVLTLAEKLKILFEYDYPGVYDVRINPVWAAGEVLRFGGKFENYVASKGLQKQEGIVFRHLLRMILLCAEMARLTPPETTEEEWQADMRDVAEQLTACCREVDPTSTEEALEQAKTAGEVHAEV